MKLKAKIVTVNDVEMVIVSKEVTNIGFRYYDDVNDTVKSHYVAIDGDWTGKPDKKVMKAIHESIPYNCTVLKIVSKEMQIRQYGIDVEQVMCYENLIDVK